MLNYSTLTLVNDPSVIYANSTKKLFRVKFGPEFKLDDEHKVKVVAKTDYKAKQLAKATVTLPSGSASDIYRLAIYLRLRNNNNPYFSNDWTFKGKPLFVEFPGNASVDDVVAIAKKYQLAQYGYDLVKFSKVSNKLQIEAVDQWEMFMDQEGHAAHAVKLQKLTTFTGDVVQPERFVDQTAVITVDNGNEAFGDFAHIVKDLRLPSAANLRWQGPHQGDVFGDEPNDDRPLPTGKYTQYTLQLDAERGIGQQTVLGGVGTSRTVHVFYVESAAVSAFDAALISAGIVVDTDADSVVDQAELSKPSKV